MSTHAGVAREHRLLRRQRTALLNTPDLRFGTNARRRAWLHGMAHMAVVLALVCLAAANLHLRWTFSEIEVGVLWSDRGGEITAQEVAPDTPAAREGIRAGDVLEQIDGRSLASSRDVIDILHAASKDTRLRYTIYRASDATVVDVVVQPLVTGSLPFYSVLASVGIFALLVGAGVRLRRPDNQASLHFFWLTVAFFGVMAFSFGGKLDALDQVF